MLIILLNYIIYNVMIYLKGIKPNPSAHSRLTQFINHVLTVKKINFNTEFRFHPERKWRFDFAIPEKKIAIEAEGGIYNNGRHIRADGYNKDCEKYNNATLLGWKVYRFTDIMLKNNTLSKFLFKILT